MGNPVAGYAVDSQFYFKDQKFIQIGTLDNTNRRLIDVEGGGLNNLENQFSIRFQQELTKEKFWFKNQSICAHYDGNSVEFDAKLWSIEKYGAENLEEGQSKIDCVT